MTKRPAPSFAVTAASMLQKQEAVDAARLCASGLEFYPDYIAGYLLLAKAYAALHQGDDARLILDEAQRRFPRHNVPKYVEPVITVESGSPIETPEISTPILPKDVVKSVPQSAPQSVLRIIDTAPLSKDQRIIRSTSVRLIPGLEYTSLRFEGMRQRGRREIAHLSDPPAFREFHTMRRTIRPAETHAEPKRSVSLEELATRLEKARMPRQMEALQPNIPSPHVSGGPTVVTETIARIYMQQGSYDRAIEAFRVLQKSKPQQHTHFEQLIAECEKARTS